MDAVEIHKRFRKAVMLKLLSEHDGRRFAALSTEIMMETDRLSNALTRHVSMGWIGSSVIIDDGKSRKSIERGYTVVGCAYEATSRAFAVGVAVRSEPGHDGRLV